MSIRNKRGGGGRKEGKMQGIDVCLIENDSVCREKIIIQRFLRLLQRIESKNSVCWKKQ